MTKPGDCIRSEGLVKKDLRKWWNTLPQVTLYAYCQPCHAGVSDYVGWWSEKDSRGRGDAFFLAVEVKKEMREGLKKMEPTDKQQSFLDKVNDDGGLSFCVSSLAECKAGFLEAGIIINN